MRSSTGCGPGGPAGPQGEQGPIGPAGPQGPAGGTAGIQRVVYGAVDASGGVLQGSGYTVGIPSAGTCNYGAGSIPCTFYTVNFSQGFAAVPVCTATLAGSQSFTNQGVIVISGTSQNNVNIQTGGSPEGSLPFNFTCVQ